MADSENASEISKMNAYSFHEDEPVLNDRKTAQQIFSHICNEIRNICTKINRVKPTYQKQITYGSERTVVVPEMTALLESKTNIINQLINHSKDLKVEDFPHFRGEASMSIPYSLMQETDSCAKAIEFLNNTKCNQKKHLKLLEEAEKICAEMEETDVEPGSSDEMIDKISSEVKKEFELCKKDMKIVMDTLFPDDTLSDVLEGLVKNSLSKQKEDEWYKIQNPLELDAIMMLISIQMVVVNPQNPLEVKLQI